MDKLSVDVLKEFPVVEYISAADLYKRVQAKGIIEAWPLKELLINLFEDGYIRFEGAYRMTGYPLRPDITSSNLGITVKGRSAIEEFNYHQETRRIAEAANMISQDANSLSEDTNTLAIVAIVISVMSALFTASSNWQQILSLVQWLQR